MGASAVFPANLPEHCTPTSQYLVKLSSAFHTCVPTNLAFLSISLGIFSIIAWLFAQLPQIYKNWRLQSAAGLSIFFLLEWLLGDITNLAGALLTGQASWQVGVATYYVFVDVCLSGQYFWYSHIKPRRKRGTLYVDLTGRDDPSEDGAGIRQSSMNNNHQPMPMQTTSVGQPRNTSEKPSLRTEMKKSGKGNDPFPTLNEKHSSTTSVPPNRPFNPSPTLLALSLSLTSLATASALPTFATNPSNPPILSSPSTAPESSPLDLAGRFISWLSTLLYLLSRLPQIYKNATRRSTSGLSPYMFLAAFLGNTFYSSALLANPLAWDSYGPYGGGGWAPEGGSERVRWVELATPFFLGAAGVLVLDGAVGVQFLIYGGGEGGREVLVPDGDVDVEGGDGEEGRGRKTGREGERGRWQRVTGWVRGWVPSPSPTPAVEVRKGRREEQESLLGGRGRSRDGDGRGYGGVD